MEGTELERLSQAEQMLATIARADDAAKLADMAEAARVYARKAELGTAAVNHATVIKARALKRMAELVDEGQRRGEIATQGRPENLTDGKVLPAATLDDLGITPKRLHEARKLEALSDAAMVDAAVDASSRGHELSVAELTRAAAGVPHIAYNSGVSEWYTPPEFIEAARRVMGSINLDPASCATANQVVAAERFYSVSDDGLNQEWTGRVWMNPPYAQPAIGDFCRKLAAEYQAGSATEACALVNNATETAWFQELAGMASAICFPRGRVKFWNPEKESAPLQGQAVLYLGEQPERFAEVFGGFGFVAVVP